MLEGAHGGQRALDLLELELQAVVSYYVWVLEMKLLDLLCKNNKSS